MTMVPDDLRDALDLLAAAAPPTGRPAQERPSRPPAELACRIVTRVLGSTGAPAALDLQGRYTARLGAISAFGAIKSRDLRETVRIAGSIGVPVAVVFATNEQLRVNGKARHGFADRDLTAGLSLDNAYRHDR